MEASNCIEEKIKKIASEIEPELIQIRHTLHQHRSWELICLRLMILLQAS